MTVDFVLCIDGGGTKTEASLRNTDGRDIAQSRTGPCNLFQDPESGLAAITQAWHACCATAGLTPADAAPRTALSAGLAGIHAPGATARLTSHFEAFAELFLSSDGYTMLAGAVPHGPGRLIAVGTGTVGCRFDPAGRFILRGGWGFPVGDEGSGAWLGLQMVAAWLRHRDGAERDPASEPLWQALELKLGQERHQILGWLRGAPPAHFASLAEIALASPAPAAQRLLDRAATHLRHLALALGGEEPLHLSGGLATSLAPRLRALMSPHQVTPCAPSALDGAFAIAMGMRDAELHAASGRSPARVN